MSLIIICGATATGKSDLAVALAQQIKAEVINADSMQLYKGMDIGTAKLSLVERSGVAHHLIDVLDIKEEANVSWYQSLAREKIDKRVEQMWAKGFAREVLQLMNQGLAQATTAKMALGYSQIMSYLNGECDEEFAKTETKRVTRAYARRQETWFSRDERINWLAPATKQVQLEKVLASIN